MNNSPNILALEKVLGALGPDLSSQMIFTGGSVVELYNQLEVSPTPRVTKDVDCIVAAATMLEYHKVEVKLHKRGFINVGLLGQKGPTCRYNLEDIIFDVMPTEGKVLGFTNRWFKLAVQNPFEYPLPSGARIKLVSFPRFLAIKIETLGNRGGTDVRGSHDLEDIVRLVSGRKEPLQELVSEIPEVTGYLQGAFRELAKNSTFIEGIEASAPLGNSQAEQVLQFLEHLELESFKAKGKGLER